MRPEAGSGKLVVEELRREFDSGFAAPPPVEEEDRESLINIRLAGEALAVRTLDITEVTRPKRITPLPTRVSGLAGVTANRGVLLPVYDLTALLGLPAAAGRGSWLIVADRETPVGLLFDELEGRVEIDRRCLCENRTSGARAHLRMIVRLGAGNRAVVDIPGLVEQIRTVAGGER